MMLLPGQVRVGDGYGRWVRTMGTDDDVMMGALEITVQSTP